MRIRGVMNFWVGDILSLWWVVKDIIIYVKNKYFSWKNWQNESLEQDILEYFKEFYKEIKELDKKSNNKAKKKLWELSDKWDYSLENFDDKFMKKYFDKYKKKWDYKKVFNDFEIKMNSYWSAVKECIENYWKNDWKKLKKERKLFDSFLDKNVSELKRWYIDFLMFSLFNDMLSSDTREKIINQNISLLDFEKYIPAIRKFLDKIDNRVLVK